MSAPISCGTSVRYEMLTRAPRVGVRRAESRPYIIGTVLTEPHDKIMAATSDTMPRGFVMIRKTFAASLTLGVAFASPAFALEADAFAERLKAALQKSSYVMEYTDATLDGSNVTLEGMKLGIDASAMGAGPDSANAFFIQDATVNFENVTEENGGYVVGRIGRTDVTGEIPEVGGEDEPASYTIGEWFVEGLRVPAEDATGLASFINADRYAIRDVSFALAGQQYVTLASAEATGTIEGNNYDTDATLSEMVVDLSVSADKSPELKSWIEGTGYKIITIDGELAGTWNLDDGQMSIPTYSFTLRDMGQFSMNMALGGLTEPVFEQLMELSQAGNADAQAQQAAGMQMLGLLAQLSFGGFEISYRDDGMADNLLEYYASENGQTKDQLVQQTVGVLPFILGRLQSPELQAQVQEAVTSFLNDPKSIRLSLKPDAPLPLPAIMGAAASPSALTEALNAQVRSGELGAME